MKRKLLGSAAARRYTLQITDDIARQLRRCRASIRQTIERKLEEIVVAAAALPLAARPLDTGGPSQRFYVFEGYRVSYVIRSSSRTVAVLAIRNEPG
jgi:mRNA-degrading endonuclease RelE of RelBE toxin-antitoxin system